jgi:hypothetical protein
MGTRNLNTRWVLPDMKVVWMISLPVGTLMGKNLYPLGRWVRVWVGTTPTRLPMGKLYLRQCHYNHLIEPILTKIKLFPSYHLSSYHVM